MVALSDRDDIPRDGAPELWLEENIAEGADSAVVQILYCR